MGILERRRAALVVGLCVLLLAGCSTPRGAGFQSEVLAASEITDETGAPVTDFAVFPVTRETLPQITGWPATGGQRSYSWIDRTAQPASLIIAPGDVLQMTIWDAEENSLLTSPGQRATQLQEVKVDSSGRIFIPFVGEMRVAGMAPQTARQRIEEQLISTVPSAQVQVSVAAGRANTANLVSGVNTPGVYPLEDRDVTVLSLIAQGGGVRSNFINPQVRLFRGREVYGTSVARLFDNPGLDTTLRGGDRVIVEEDERYFLSLGAAGTEALHVFPKDHVTALDALSIIGGVSDARADPQGILILRDYPASAVRGDGADGPPQDRVVFTIDLTRADGLFSAGKFAVQTGDLVYVTESPVTTARTIFSLISSTASVVNQLN